MELCSQFNLEGKIDCNYIIEGCTDETALNYNPVASKIMGRVILKIIRFVCCKPYRRVFFIVVWDPVCG